MRLKDLIDTEQLRELIKVSAAAVGNPVTERIIRHELKYGPEVWAWTRRLVNRLSISLEELGEREIQRQIAAEQAKEGQVVVQLDAHLDPASFLIALETARVLLADRLRRHAVLDQIAVDDATADDVLRRLTLMMNEIRSTEKQMNAPDHFPALESGIE